MNAPSPLCPICSGNRISGTMHYCEHHTMVWVVEETDGEPFAICNEPEVADRMLASLESHGGRGTIIIEDRTRE